MPNEISAALFRQKFRRREKKVFPPGRNNERLAVSQHVSRVNYRFPERGSIKYRFLVAHKQPAGPRAPSASTRRGSMSCSHLMSCIRMHACVQGRIRTQGCVQAARTPAPRGRRGPHKEEPWRSAEEHGAALLAESCRLTSRCCRCHEARPLFQRPFATVRAVSTDNGDSCPTRYPLPCIVRGIPGKYRDPSRERILVIPVEAPPSHRPVLLNAPRSSGPVHSPANVHHENPVRWPCDRIRIQPSCFGMPAYISVRMFRKIAVFLPGRRPVGTLQGPLFSCSPYLASTRPLAERANFYRATSGRFDAGEDE